MQLECGDREIRLSRKAFALLRILIASRHRVVEKAELHAQLWPDTFVSDANLNVLVLEIRRALDDPARDARLLRTIHGVGYRFIAQVETESTGPALTGAPCWLVTDERRYAIPGDEVTVGRDPSCDVWLDAPGVSRWHARIRITANGDAVLEDSNSTNGTYVGKSRITGPTRLRDGDEIHFGSCALTFRTRAASKETERVRPPA
jgi:DNA-binding winged helix-turn-helix (wHTH) protein